MPTKPINIENYRLLAKRRLPRMVFDYLEGGAEDERGLKRNRDAFESLRFQPRRLVDVSQRDLSVSVLGSKLETPLIVGPTGLNGVFWPDGDLVLARAARKFGAPFVLSTASNASIEAVGKCGGELWFQLYVVHKRLAQQLVGRALDAGYTTLVLTTDVSVNGKRERDLRNGFALPIRYSARTFLDGMRHPRWSMDLLRHGMPQLANFASQDASDIELQAALMSRQMDASFQWADLEALRAMWPHRLIVKGLSRAEDVRRCIDLGVDGVILSNHGGRQLDDAEAPMESLMNVPAQFREEGRVLIDSGFRRGSDVVKALALGASAVLLGRATLYGLAALGEEGVLGVLELLRDEIDKTLAHLGCPRLVDLGPEWIRGAPEPLRRGGDQSEVAS